MANRKGISQVLIWVFVIAAGAMLLILFGIIASQQADSAKDRINRIAITQIESILATQQAASDVSVRVPVVNQLIDLTCGTVDDFLVSDIRIGGQALGLRRDLVAGGDIQTDEIILFSKQLNLPYDIGNILFLTSDNDLLVIDSIDENTYDGQIQQLINDLPEDFPVYSVNLPNEGVHADQITGNVERYDNVRVILFGADDSSRVNDVVSRITGRKNNVHVFVVNHPVTEPNVESGQIQYYTWDEFEFRVHEDGPLNYHTPEMLLALAYQNTWESASCLQTKIDEQQVKHANLHKQRFQLLRQGYGTNACAGLYSEAALDSLSLLNIQSSTPTVYQQAIVGVANQNAAFNRGRRCATTY